MNTRGTQFNTGGALDQDYLRKQAEKCISLLSEVEERLSARELGFYEEVKEKLEDEDCKGWSPTYPQVNWLKDLVGRYCY